MPIDLILAAITGGATMCGVVWKIHHSLNRKSLEHETRLKDIEHCNDMQQVHIDNMKVNHSGLDTRLVRVEDNIESLKISVAEILQILKHRK
ncbi:hypothetical protein D3C75_185260 [compost metagenome]